jgi:hypothetical protein
LGAPETTTASHVRNLREAGLLTKTGRGITAAQMTTRDAAHLLIATAASLNVKDSAATVADFTKIESRYGQPKIRLARYADLNPDHSFTDALVALLDLVVAGEFTSPSEFGFYARLFGPRVRAEIEWTDHKNNTGSIADYWMPPSEWVRGEGLKQPSVDLERRATFTEFTILQVGALIGGFIDTRGERVTAKRARRKTRG